MTCESCQCAQTEGMLKDLGTTLSEQHATIEGLLEFDLLYKQEIKELKRLHNAAKANYCDTYRKLLLADAEIIRLRQKLKEAG